MSNIFKKVISTALGAVMCVSMVTGCGSKPVAEKAGAEETQQVEKAEPAQTTEQQTTISFVHWRSEDAEVYKKLIGQFEEKNPNIKVEMEVTSADQNQYYALLKARLAGKDGLDVLAIHPGSYLKEFQKSGQLMDLTAQKFVSNYEQGMVESCTVDGKVYGLPQGYNLHTIFYNKEIFDKYGLKVPKTWDEMMQISKVLKENGEGTIASGSAEEWVHEMPYIQLMGSYFKDEPLILKKLEAGEVKLTDEKFQNIFKDYQDLNKNGAFMKDVMGTKYEPSLALFAQGKAAMLNTGTWSVGGLKQQNPDLKFGIFLLPSRAGSPVVQVSPAQAIAISANTKKQEASLKFVDYLSTVESATLYANATMQNSGVKGVKLDMEEMNLASDLIQSAGGKSYTCYHLLVENQKVMEIIHQAMIRGFLGEDIAVVTEDLQKQLDIVLK